MKSKTKDLILTTDLRGKLKELFQTELSKLPEYLDELPVKEKLDYLFKLMPFVLPKVENVNYNKGEPDEYRLRVWTE